MRATASASPPRYVPVRHPGLPRRWGRASIVDALRAWVAEAGGPPRRQDWCGERPASPTSAQRKWMSGCRRRVPMHEAIWERLRSHPATAQRYLEQLAPPEVARLMELSEAAARRKVLERLARPSSAAVLRGDLSEAANG